MTEDFELSSLRLEGVPPAHAEFARIELSRTKAYYRRRAAMLGMRNGTVLDAGCGVGQWSTVFAEINQYVIGIDLSADRIDIARRLSQPVKNVEFCVGSIENLTNISDVSVDFVFCYGVIMFTDIDATLREFARVLKPGGKAYVCGNCLGWSLYLMLGRGLRQKEWRCIPIGFEGIWNTLARHVQGTKFLTPTGFASIAEKVGFSNALYGPEGSLNFEEAEVSPPIYPGRYLGIPCVGEWLLTK